MTAYNGYKSWAQWNVSLWINNDEGLYRLALQCARRHGKREGAMAMLTELRELGLTHTPDGARYTVTSIRAAMAGM